MSKHCHWVRRHQGGRSRRRRVPSEGDGAGADGDDHGAADSKRTALEEIISSFRDREDKAMAEAEGLRGKAREAATTNRVLFDRYACVYVHVCVCMLEGVKSAINSFTGMSDLRVGCAPEETCNCEEASVL